MHRPASELLVAFNFSYFVFKRRADLLAYFANARRSLSREGLFIIDLLGGPAAQGVSVERRKIKGFDYLWDQAAYNPIDGDYLCHIHFEFPDGTRLKKAFTYDWRLWNLAEVRDVLVEAGFSRTEVYWEGTDHVSGGGNGVYKRRLKATNDECWISYVVGIP